MFNFIMKIALWAIKRVPRTHIFGDDYYGDFPVPAHRHPNGGGWVANTARVHPTAMVEWNAEVSGCAEVGAHSEVRDWAYVCDSAIIGDFVYIRGRSSVSDTALVYTKDREAHIIDSVIRGNTSMSDSCALESIIDDGIFQESNVQNSHIYYFTVRHGENVHNQHDPIP